MQHTAYLPDIMHFGDIIVQHYLLGMAIPDDIIGRIIPGLGIHALPVAEDFLAAILIQGPGRRT